MERVRFMDIAKGLGIFLTIIGHHPLPSVLNHWIYAFHMPLFFIIAGYFWHPRTLKEEFVNAFKNLLLPLWNTKLLWTLLLLILYNYKGYYTGPVINNWIYGGLFEKGSFHLAITWFLAALFWGKIWLNVLNSLKEQYRYIIVFCLFFFPYLTKELWLNGYGTSFPCNFLQGMMTPLFMTIGIRLRSLCFFDKDFNIFTKITMIGCLMLAYQMPINMGAMLYPHTIWSIISASVASISIIWACKYIDKRFGYCFMINIITFCGKYSLAILCIHALEFSIQANRVLPDFIPRYCHGVIFFFAIIVSVFLLKKIALFRFIFNMKK